MAKWINTATGLEVPAVEVRELVPGSGIYVHESVVTVARIVEGAGGRGSSSRVSNLSVSSPGPVKVVDGYAVKIADDATYDPAVDNVQRQTLESQAAQRARGA